MKGKTDQDGNLIAFGDYPDGVELPDQINGGNYFQYRLINTEFPEDINSWIMLESNFEYGEINVP